LQSSYKLFRNEERHFAKFFSNPESSEWRWPFLDLFFFDDFDGLLEVRNMPYVGPTSIFLPARKIKLMGVEVRKRPSATATRSVNYRHFAAALKVFFKYMLKVSASNITLALNKELSFA
jgi:hypothetical protein